MANHPQRFDGRAILYDRYRPEYPDEIGLLLAQRSGGESVADIGAGTGKLTRILAPVFKITVAVEPNAEMRAILRSIAGVQVLDGTAESTNIADSSVHVVVAGQAFHWFDPTAIKSEWTRILGGPQIVAVIYNQMVKDSPFARRYTEIHARFQDQPHSESVKKARSEEAILNFLHKPEIWEFSHVQALDCEGLIGRAASHSSFPMPRDPRYEAAQAEFSVLYEEFERGGKIELPLRARVYLGTLS